MEMAGMSLSGCGGDFILQMQVFKRRIHRSLSHAYWYSDG